MFIKREEMLRRARLFVLELVSAREAAIGIHLVVSSRRASFLRPIDTRTLADLHAAILPLLEGDDDLSARLTVVRGQADVLNFRLQNLLPRFYRPQMEKKYVDPDFEVFNDVGGDAWKYADQLGKVIEQFCKRVDVSTPKL